MPGRVPKPLRIPTWRSRPRVEPDAAAAPCVQSKVASVTNPVDMLAAATAEQYAQSIRIIAEDPSIDALISIFLPPLATQSEDVARCVLAPTTTKPSSSS